MASVPATANSRFTLPRWLDEGIEDLGDLTTFAGSVLSWTFQRPGRGTIVPVFFSIGVNSIPVVAITGLFIGMVLAVQAYDEFAYMGLQTRLGGIINASVVRELGPVLAATMLAGRVGSAIAAELATMRITEQIDALACLGSNPIHFLAVPRFLACMLLIPLLTVIANFMGVMGGALIATQTFGIDAHHYWVNAQAYMRLWDVVGGLVKPTFFGAAIGIISCHRGFTSKAGAEGVGRAATAAFVAAFVAILMLDFFLALLLSDLYNLIWPASGGKGL